MTATDALIEKMARAMYEANGRHRGYPDYNLLAFDETVDPTQKAFRKMAHAAYEAEHEEDGK